MSEQISTMAEYFTQLQPKVARQVGPKVLLVSKHLAQWNMTEFLATYPTAAKLREATHVPQTNPKLRVVGVGKHSWRMLIKAMEADRFWGDVGT